MFRRRLTLSFLFVGTALFGAGGCAKELEISPPVDATAATIAQFDPTNPIPVLRLVPAPTGIVQDPLTGDLEQDRVAAQECELPSTKQCLQFVRGGWPTTTPITLYFSKEVDSSTVKAGIVLLKAGAPNTAPTPVDYDFEQMARPAPPQACLDQFMIGSDRVPPGVQLVIKPKPRVDPSSRYIMIVRSAKGGAAGLKGTDGTPVEPTALFHLLNTKDTGDEADLPATASGQINNPLLRQQVTDLTLAAVAPGKTLAELTPDEKARFDAGYQESALGLFGLHTFFNAVITPLEGTLIMDRETLVFVNTWSTGPAVWEFDPQNSKVPFPNVQLLTRTTTTVNGGLAPAIPNNPPNPIVTAINATLNGFSTTSSIVMTAAANIDINSIDPTPETPCTPADCKIVMYRLDGDGAVADPAGVELVVHVINGTDEKLHTDTATISIHPAIPLDQNTEYVVGVKRGVKSFAGAPIDSATTFDLLKSPTPFVNDMGQAVDTIQLYGQPFPLKTALQCSTVPLTGELALDPQVQGLAGALETLVQHQRWQPAFAALENLTPKVERPELLMAFTYKTQDITPTLDLVKHILLDPPVCVAQGGCWDALLPDSQPRIIDTGIDVRGQAAIAAAIGVVPTLCVPVCEQGAMEPQIPRDMCATRDQAGNIIGVNPDLPAHTLCQTAIGLVTSRIGSIHKYILKGFTATSGGPFSSDPRRPGTFTPGTIQLPRVTNIPMWVTYPSSTTAPSRVMIFQHGLGSVKEAGFYIMNTLAGTSPLDPSGWATVMIDLPYHGERASDLISNTTQLPCAEVDPANVSCVDPDGPGPQPVACVDLVSGNPPCDGNRDPSGTGFLGVNLFATRDNFRQATIDQLTLVRALRLEGNPTGLLPSLDGSHIAYIGQSLGSITGGNLAAYTSPGEIEHFTLNVGGGGLVTNILLRTVPQIAAPLYFALAANGVCELVDPQSPAKGCQDTPAFRRFRIIAQWVLDPGDPLATSIGVTRELSPGRTPYGSDNIMLQMSVPDPVVSNQSSRALETAYYGTDMAAWGDHFQPYDFTAAPQSMTGSGCHGYLLGPICGQCLFDNICNTLGAQVQAATFSRTGMIISRGDSNVAVTGATGVPCDDLSTPDMNEACQ